jgi:fucose 4-O-acetylase-like acetyltransferase
MSMNASATNRILTLDIAKGIGILLVVLGHNPVFREGAHSLYEAIYLFHMPLFFFLSGVTFRPGSPGDVGRKRARALLVPYFVMGLLGVLAALAAGPFPALTELGGVVYATGHTIRFVPLWFLPCLFMASMAATFVMEAARALTPAERLERMRTTLLVLLALAGLVLGSLILRSQVFAEPPYVDDKGRPLGLPWSLDLVPFVLGVFFVGTLAARAPLVYRCPQPWLVLLATASVLAILTAYGASIDLNYRRLTHPVAAVVAMTSGIVMVMALSTLVARIAWAARLFGYLGSASLVILMLHSPLQRRLVHPILNSHFPEAVTVVGSLVITVGLICAFDLLVLRRVHALGWVVYRRREAL